MDESAMFGLNGDNDDMGWGKNLGVVDNGGEVDDGKWLQEICDTLERKCDEYNQSFLVSSEVKGSGEDDDDDCVILDGDPDKVGVESENVAVGGDSDELVVVGETGQSFLVSSEVKGSGEDDDDDCVILDGDPDKVGVESENVAVGGDSDELVVVGETGQAFQAQMARPGRTEAMNMTTIRGQSSAVPRTNLQPDLASLQSRNTGNNLARNRRHNVGSSGPRVNVTPAAMFKRSGTPGVASASNQRTGHLINGRGSTLYTRLPNAVLAPDNCNNVISAQANGNSSMCGPSLQQYMHQRPNIMAFQSQLQSRLFSQSTVATNQVFTQPLFSDLSNRSTVFLYSTTQPQIPSQKENVGSMSSRPGLPQPQVSLQPDLPNSSANTVPSQPPVSYQTSHASNYQQNIIQQQNQINNFGDTGFSEIALNWLTNTTIPSSQQSQEQNSQLPASGSFDEFDCFFSGSSAFDLIRDPWTLNGEESARISSESATATVDVGTLFG
uniref:Uncharacterized protein n=1 Tax=Daucus carota subsp. sativus TaxID=79200 RepID=A0A161WYS6_DAUCS